MKQSVVSGVLLGLVILSLFLRMYKLGSVPDGLNRDEAALAYNGYLLSESNKDEWGKTWPLTLQSFGDYKLLGYPAILSFLFKFLPENDLVVRLPSAVFGSVLVVAVYYLARELAISKSSALIAAASVAVSPVFLFYSRIAFEAVVALTLFVAGVSLLFRQVVRPKLYLDGVAVLLMLTAMLVYNTPLLLFPFILSVVPLVRGVTNYKTWLPVLAVGVIVWITVYAALSSAISQKSGITIFTDETTTIEYPAYREQFSGLATTLLGNKYVYYSTLAGKNFIESFSYTFLVQEGGEHPWHTLMNWGHLYGITYLLSLVGLGMLLLEFIKKIFALKKLRTLKQQLVLKVEDRSLLILFLTVIGVGPSVITVDSPHATRSLFFFVALVLASGYCIDFFQKLIKSTLKVYVPYRRTALGIVILLIVFIQSSQFISDYFKNYPTQSADLFQPNRAGVLQQALKQFPEKPIAVIDGAGYDYILVSWYLLIPPDQYFTSVVRQQPDRIGFRYGERVGQFHFIVNKADKRDEVAAVFWNGTRWVLE